MRRDQIGFTLIELLVVVTIIVVLLALLVPAMDKAIYRAELAVCGARQKGVVNAVGAYAVENNRLYPYRPTQGPSGGVKRPNYIEEGALDDRPALTRALGSLDILLDPLSGGINIDDAPTDPNAYVVANYELWFGVQYATAQGGRGMRKIGDRLEWDGERFSVLVSDEDAILVGTGLHAGHPDSNGLMLHGAIQAAPDDQYNSGGKYTLSRWYTNNGQITRGTLDTNYAFDDGAVLRYHGVTYDEELDPASRIEKVPMEASAQYFATRWLHLPRH